MTSARETIRALPVLRKGEALGMLGTDKCIDLVMRLSVEAGFEIRYTKTKPAYLCVDGWHLICGRDVRDNGAGWFHVPHSDRIDDEDFSLLVDVLQWLARPGEWTYYAGRER